MAMPDYGSTIRMSQINVELGRSLNTTISLSSAEKGGYVALESDSVWIPDGVAPFKMNEWYGYDHSASGWTVEKSLLHDGVDDYSRWTGSDWTKIANIFQAGGTLAFAFHCTGPTSNTNQYIMQGGWIPGSTSPPGANWLLNFRDYDSGAFQVRFRHDFTGNNLKSECATSSGERPFAEDRWYFLCLTYDNSSTSNKPSWYYASYADTSVTAIGSSPYMELSPSGAFYTVTSSSAEFPAIAGAKGSAAVRPYLGYVTMVGMWNRELSSSEVGTLFNGGAPYQFSKVNNGQLSQDLLQFHDMTSLSGFVMTPETTEGGTATGYNLLLVNGVSQETEVPS